MSNILNANLKNRESLIEGIEEEIVGPISDFSGAQQLTEKTHINEKNNGFYYWEYSGREEEIFLGSKPSKQYAAGILFPLSKNLEEVQEEAGLTSDVESDISKDEIKEDEKNEDSLQEDKVQAQNYLPSNIGITFAVSEKTKTIKVDFNCGVYENKEINKEIQMAHGTKFWFRKSLYSEMELDVSKETSHEKIDVNLKTFTDELFNKISLRIDSICRTVKLEDSNEKVKIITITATNITREFKERDDEYLLFQSQLNIENSNLFIPYPNASQLNANIPDEDKKFDMLYQNEYNYAFGQNCSTTWEPNRKEIDKISTTFIPTYEIKTMTPDIEISTKDGKKEKIEISHASIVACKTQRELGDLFEPLIKGYEDWHEKLKKEKLNSYYDVVFNNNMKDIEKSIKRIRNGINIITNPRNDKAFDSFKLTNLAMLMQMTNGKEQREIISDDGEVVFETPYNNIFSDLDFNTMDSLSNSVLKSMHSSDKESPWIKYKWRGFQIAFILLSIESIVNKESIDRKEVDLIWFPTGGGKTEAYLGVAAFSMLYRRLLNPDDTGVDIIMRYTLRLLTADQFQRSTRLISSLDYIRSYNSKRLGEVPYTIGLWVGQSSTPNKTTGRNSAEERYKNYLKNRTPNFPIDSCPWCGAKMTMEKSGAYHGYKFTNKLDLYCPDNQCHFHDSLPISFVDEELYKERPTFLIGTIDKFVQLTWEPKARTLFGLDENGNRIYSPPNIIIQDELHLISGPLGTLTGIYESLIEWLCTDRIDGKKVLPKIICATATIKAYKEQIQSIFGRNKELSNLFPPAGVDINDNYFSKVLTINQNGKEVPAPGRKYVGVYAFTQGKLQTQVQTNSSLISKVSSIPADNNQRDPFWTILSFYNTINDIGKAKTLTEQDIPNTLKNYYDLRGIKNGRMIKQSQVKELTSRMPSDEVSSSLKVMAEPYHTKNNKALDIVLASNIIEVGVDIDRLSLMTINGQPKTTAQYIQVSGRIGRKTEERPGLVVTIYNPTSSNDKSHFEHFNEYHQKLYSQVEESSVTPFSRFSIERGIPAILIGFLRQAFNEKVPGKTPSAEHIIENIGAIGDFMNYVIARAEKVDNTEIEFLRKKANEVIDDLSENAYGDWRYNSNSKDSTGYMAPMTHDQEDVPDNVKTIMFSMRSVDAISMLKVFKIKSANKDKKRWGF